MPVELKPLPPSKGSTDEMVSFDQALHNSRKHEEIEGVAEESNESRFNNNNVKIWPTIDRDETSVGLDSLDNSRKSFSGRSASSVSTTVAIGIARAASNWKILLFGQAVSLSVFAIGATASELVYMCDLNAPVFQFSWMYFMLLFHLVYRIISFSINERKAKGQKKKEAKKYVHEELFELNQVSGQSSKETSESAIAIPQYYFPFTSMPMSGAWWVYFVIAFLEVEANYFTLLAYRYTTFTSVTLLDSLAIPASMIASKFILKSRYGTAHLIGVCICLLGSALNILIDLEDVANGTVDTQYDHKVLGDMIAIIGAILLGINDAIIEMLCKKHSTQEFLSMIGFFGSIICLVQIFFLEMDEIARFFTAESTCSKASGFSLLFTCAIANYLSTIGQAYFLLYSEAALMNLSMLTSDLFAVFFSILFEAVIPNASFYVALLLIMIGIIVYEIGPSPMTKINENNPDGVNVSDLKKSQQLLTVFEINIPKTQFV